MNQLVPKTSVLALLAVLATTQGCKPSIGDGCSISTDCSSKGDRLCDTSQPGGYCTQFNCQPDNCPDDAVCVAFEDDSCVQGQGLPRLRRTFCVKSCTGDGDCRGGYKCQDVGLGAGRRAVFVDVHPTSQRACLVPLADDSDAGMSASMSSELPAVCQRTDAESPRSSSPAPDAAPLVDSAADSPVQDAPADEASPALPEATLEDAPFEADAWPGDGPRDALPDASDGSDSGQ